MKRTGIAFCILCALASAAFADEVRYVYEIRELSGSASDPWSMNMGAAAEAARLFAPVSFSKAGGKVSIDFDATLSFSLGGSSELERSETRVLVRHEATLQGAIVLPKAFRRTTIRFSLSELVKKGGSYGLSPLMYAFRKAIDGSALKSGKAWIESCAYAGGKFVVVVAFAKG